MTLILSGTNGLSDVDGDASTPAVRGTDANSGIFFGADTVGVSTNGVERVEFGNSETVFNDGGADVDFRVEGDTDANLLFVDASADAVGIGTGTPQNKLQVMTTVRPQFAVSYDGTTGLYLEDSTNSAWKSWKLSTAFGAGSDLSFVQSTNTSGTPTWAAAAAMTLDWYEFACFRC
jgi:hypothetical protein